MRKIRIFLNVFAVVIAMSGAYASAHSTLIPGYIRVNNPIEPCQPSRECNNIGATCLDASGKTVFDGAVMNSTSCGNVLKHQ
jgi:hypothetical protein